MLRIPHCLHNRLTDGGKFVSLTRRPTIWSPETLFFSYLSGSDFSYVGVEVAQCFRHFDTTRKIAASTNHEVILSIYLILPDELAPRLIQMSPGVWCSRCVRLTTSPPAVSRLSKQCGNVNISQPYRSPQPVTRICKI
jgi:hypothetical protein